MSLLRKILLSTFDQCRNNDTPVSVNDAIENVSDENMVRKIEESNLMAHKNVPMLPFSIWSRGLCSASTDIFVFFLMTIYKS